MCSSDLVYLGVCKEQVGGEGEAGFCVVEWDVREGRDAD